MKPLYQFILPDKIAQQRANLIMEDIYNRLTNITAQLPSPTPTPTPTPVTPTYLQIQLPVCGGVTLYQGAFVNIYQSTSSGPPCVRLANAYYSPTLPAHGFVLDIANPVTVYLSGLVNTKPYGTLDIPVDGFYYLARNGGIDIYPPPHVNDIIQKVGVGVTAPGAGLQLLFIYHEAKVIP